MRDTQFSHGTGGECRSNLLRIEETDTHRHSSEVALVDVNDRIVGLLGGHPKGVGVDWDAVKDEASAAIKAAQEACNFAPHQTVHRRGDFATLTRGVSFGGGRKVRIARICMLRTLS